jgi:ubiquinone/menaquinone biosynthesis C-methylase UbiE
LKFPLELPQRVGSGGRVVAADISESILERARHAR